MLLCVPRYLFWGLLLLGDLRRWSERVERRFPISMLFLCDPIMCLFQKDAGARAPLTVEPSMEKLKEAAGELVTASSLGLTTYVANQRSSAPPVTLPS